MSETKRPTGGVEIGTGYGVQVMELGNRRKNLALVVGKISEQNWRVVAYFRSDDDAALFLAALGG